MKQPPLHYVEPHQWYSDDGMTCRIRIPCHVPTGNDLTRMHHMQQHKIKLRQQESVYLSLISHCREWTREPIKRQEITHITLTRLGPRRGDPDKAVVFAMWAIRDAICAWIALGGDIRTRTPGNYDDIVLGGASPRAYLTMQYAQELAPIGTSGKRGFGVQIELDRTPGFVPPPRAAKKILAQGT